MTFVLRIEWRAHTHMCAYNHACHVQVLCVRFGVPVNINMTQYLMMSLK